MELRSIGLKFVLVCLLSAIGTGAQSQSDGEEIEEVIVVGTRIPRVDFVSPSPVYTIMQEEMELSGTSTLAEYLNRFPLFAPDTDSTDNLFGDGAARLNLRALGAKRTLVMIDGQRLGPSGTTGAVDINGIPAAFVERVEVLTGGASAVYGSDAVTGVVNLVLKRDFEGFEFQNSYEKTDRGDGEAYNVTLALGKAVGDSMHVGAYYNYTDRKSIPATAREVSKDSLTTDFATGEIIPFGSGIPLGGRIPVPAVINGEFSRMGTTFAADGAPQPFTNDNRFDFQDFVILQTPLERHSGGLFLEFEGDAVSFHADVLATESEVVNEIAPVPGIALVQINSDNPNLTPEAQQVLLDNYDFAGTGLIEIFFLRRLAEVGSRNKINRRRSLRVSVGAEGVFKQWNWQADYTYSNTNVRETLSNAVSGRRFRQSLLVDPQTGACMDTSDGCVGANLFGPGNLSPEAAAFLRIDSLTSRGSAKQQVLSAAARNELDLLFDFPLNIVLGLEWREDESDFDPDDLLFDEDVLYGFGSNSVIRGQYDVRELFVELLQPLIKDRKFAEALSVEAGYRYSDYSSIGAVSTYKAGLSWKFNETVLIRAMVQRAVRAPNILEQFEAESSGLLNDFLFEATDPCSASADPVANGIADICISQGLDPALIGVFEEDPFFPTMFATGGNRSLEAEEADTYTFGFTWQPPYFEGLSLAIDYYSIEIENAIDQLDTQTVSNVCYSTGDLDFCSDFQRGPSGNVEIVDIRPRNVSQITSKGIDLQLSLTRSFWAPGAREGSLRLSLLANWIDEISVKTDPLSETVHCAGFFGFVPCGFSSFGTLPEFKTVTRFTYTTGPVTADLTWRWLDSARNGITLIEFLFPEAILAVPKLDSENYLDLNFSWELGENFTVYGGIINLTDNDPPLLGFNEYVSNTDPSSYDILGRRYHLGLHWWL